MKQFLTRTHALLISRRDDERGAGMAEYGLLITGIAGVAAAAVFALGGPVAALYDVTFGP